MSYDLPSTLKTNYISSQDGDVLLPTLTFEFYVF